MGMPRGNLIIPLCFHAGKQKPEKIEAAREFLRRDIETIIQPFNSGVGKFLFGNCGQMIPDVWNVAEPFEVKYRQPVRQRR